MTPVRLRKGQSLTTIRTNAEKLREAGWTSDRAWDKAREFAGLPPLPRNPTSSGASGSTAASSTLPEPKPPVSLKPTSQDSESGRRAVIQGYWCANYPHTYAALEKAGSLPAALEMAADIFPPEDEDGFSWIPPVSNELGVRDLLIMEAILNCWRVRDPSAYAALETSDHDGGLVEAIQSVEIEIERERGSGGTFSKVLRRALENGCPMPEARWADDPDNQLGTASEWIQQSVGAEGASKHRMFVSRVERGDVLVGIDRPFARQFYTKVRLSEIAERTGESPVFEKAVVMGAWIGGPLALLGSFVLFVRAFGVWAVALCPVALASWVVFSSMSTAGRGRLRVISVLTIAAGVYWASGPSVVAATILVFAVALWLTRVMYVSATFFLRAFVVRNARAYDWLEQHLVIRNA